MPREEAARPGGLLYCFICFLCSLLSFDLAHPPLVGVDKVECAVVAVGDVRRDGGDGVFGYPAQHIAPHYDDGVTSAGLQVGQDGTVAAECHAAVQVAHGRGGGREVAEDGLPVPVVGQESALGETVEVPEQQTVTVEVEYLRRLGPVVHLVGVWVKAYHGVDLRDGGYDCPAGNSLRCLVVERNYLRLVVRVNHIDAEHSLDHRGATA